MEHDQKPIKINSDSYSCPHLSLRYDAATYSAYPSINNACYRGQRPETPKISHQRTFCLSPKYINCAFLNNQEMKKFPREIKYKFDNRYQNLHTKIILGVLAVLAAVTMVYIWAVGGNESGGILEKPSQTPMMSPTVSTADAPRSSDSTAVVLVSPTYVPTSTASPTTVTPTVPDPVLALETPIGGQYQFIIHRVLVGESLQFFADQYNTSREAISAANKNLIVPLWVGSIVVIPVNTNDRSEIPAFLTHQIEEEGITVSLIAEKFSVQKETLAFYNNLDTEHILHQGEWLLIPQE
jgi:hypothetical protein